MNTARTARAIAAAPAFVGMHVMGTADKGFSLLLTPQQAMYRYTAAVDAATLMEPYGPEGFSFKNDGEELFVRPVKGFASDDSPETLIRIRDALKAMADA